MASSETLLECYLHLAAAFQETARPMPADKFYVLAAEIAHYAGLPQVERRCLDRVLSGNPQHMLAKYSDVGNALADDDFRSYCRQLHRLYPFERAEFLLARQCQEGYSGNHGFADLLSTDEFWKQLRADVKKLDPPRSDGPGSKAGSAADSNRRNPTLNRPKSQLFPLASSHNPTSDLGTVPIGIEKARDEVSPGSRPDSAGARPKNTKSALRSSGLPFAASHAYWLSFLLGILVGASLCALILLG